ncbi:MAG: hypothetical protein J5865_00575 [Lachnospiraceae bacterium]|nr:hypothetical protein [Lachnospiraceae bacterium]
MFCARCGKEIPQGSGFCPNCGLQVARNTMPQAQESAQQAVNNAANNAGQAMNNAANAAQQNFGGAQQSANPYVQQAANPYVQQPQAPNPYAQQSYGASGYGQPAAPNAGGYQQPYGQGQQMGYRTPQQGNYQQMDYQQGFTVPEQKKSKKGLIIGLIAAAVIGLIAILLFVWPGFLSGGGAAGSPEKTIKNFGASLQKLDFKGMIKCFDPDSQKKLENSIDQLGDLNLGGFDLSSLVEMMNLKVDMDVIDVNYDSDKTSCTANVHMKMSYSFMGYSDSTEENAPIRMTKVGGKWYIDGSALDLEDFLGDIMGGIY